MQNKQRRLNYERCPSASGGATCMGTSYTLHAKGTLSTLHAKDTLNARVTYPLEALLRVVHQAAESSGYRGMHNCRDASIWEPSAARAALRISSFSRLRRFRSSGPQRWQKLHAGP